MNSKHIVIRTLESNPFTVESEECGQVPELTHEEMIAQIGSLTHPEITKPKYMGRGSYEEVFRLRSQNGNLQRELAAMRSRLNEVSEALHGGGGSKEANTTNDTCNQESPA